MVEFDKNRTTEHLTALGYPPPTIELELIAIANLHEALQAVFDAWLDGRELEFEFNGVSLSQIKEKEGCDHLNALSTMSMFLKKPESVELFLSATPEAFRRHCGGHQVGAA